jgi:hypothetical protein
MTRRMLLSVVSAALVALGASQAASAQTRYDFKMAAAFVANGKALPAGAYVFTVNPGGDIVTLESADPKVGSVALPVETRIAQGKPLTAPEVVFDKLNGQLMVSELLVPGEDGYLLLVTKGKHTHESTAGSRKK